MTLISAVAGPVAAQGVVPAFACEIGDAAKLPSDASYPSLKEIDWSSDVYNGSPGNGSAVDWLRAVDKAFVMGATINSKLLKAELGRLLWLPACRLGSERATATAMQSLQAA